MITMTSTDIKRPVIDAESIAYVYSDIVSAVDGVTPERNRVIRAKSVDALYIEALRICSRRKSTVRVGDIVVYECTCDRVGPHPVTRYRSTCDMRVARISKRLLIGTTGRRARHDDVLVIIRG